MNWKDNSPHYYFINETNIFKKASIPELIYFEFVDFSQEIVRHKVYHKSTYGLIGGDNATCTDCAPGPKGDIDAKGYAGASGVVGVAQFVRKI